MTARTGLGYNQDQAIQSGSFMWGARTQPLEQLSAVSQDALAGNSMGNE